MHTKTEPLPQELLELILCRDVYHCTPPELAKVPLAKVMAHLTCIDMEQRVASLHGLLEKK